MTLPLTLRYVDCDRDLAQPASFLSQLVASATARPVRVIQRSDELVDLQFTSVQLPLVRKVVKDAQRVIQRGLPRGTHAKDPRWGLANPEPKGMARSHVWFTGENVRPPAGAWDGYLSFDTDPLGGLNAYLPLWFYSAGVFGAPWSPFTTRMPSWQQMLESREPGAPRPNFACAFINNPEPMRMHAIRTLSRVGPVDVFGSAAGRPVPDKAALAREYRFVLCFENDVYPGYVTEKPFEAWAAGAVPLWRGSDPAGYVNPHAVLNADEATSLEEFAEEVAQVDADPSLWQHRVSQPIILKAPDLESAKELVRKAVS